jgi:putative methanogenesis marker 16 metalloprotein
LFKSKEPILDYLFLCAFIISEEMPCYGEYQRSAGEDQDVMITKEEIREKVRDGSAVIVTAEELKRRIAAGEQILGEVDVVTCGTCGVMSGTYAVLSVQVVEPGSFTRAESIRLNGVPGIPGPCPNERLGLVDCIMMGTAHANSRYGGGDLFQDIIADRVIDIEVQADGKTWSTSISGFDISHARLFTTRSGFRNYSAMTNRGSSPVETIFSALPLAGDCTQVTVSGCGEINPLENDPTLRFLTPGSQVMINGAAGYLIGTGTRSSPVRPNIAVHGEMTEMDPLFCGGFITSAGPECLTSIGTAIPLVDEAAVLAASIRDCDIHIPINDIADRSPVGEGRYDRIWSGTSRSVRFHQDRCRSCASDLQCRVRLACPVGAITETGEIDPARCFCCGTCVLLCPDAYRGEFGSLPFEGEKIPIVLRQSDRRRADLICRRVKRMIEEGRFYL